MRDLRVPIGLFFLIVGIVLVSMAGARAELTQAEVNLYAGLTMLGFGAVMLWLARRARSHY